MTADGGLCLGGFLIRHPEKRPPAQRLPRALCPPVLLCPSGPALDPGPAGVPRSPVGLVLCLKLFRIPGNLSVDVGFLTTGLCLSFVELLDSHAPHWRERSSLCSSHVALQLVPGSPPWDLPAALTL